jgi:uncharacterized membrane protein
MIDWLTGGAIGSGGRLVWTSPDWVVTVAGVLALLALVAAVRGRRSLPALLGELLLWALALSGAVVALARPVWVEEKGRTEPGRVAVLVDASSSMAVREGSRSRSDDALAKVDALAKDGAEVFHFGGTLEPGAPDAFDLPETDLESALQALSDRYAGEKLAAVAVISDGIDRGLLRRRFQREENPVPPPTPGPLTVYQVGRPAELRDLSVHTVDAGGYAYVHAPFTIRASVLGLGFAGKTVDVSLLQDGGQVASKSVQLDPKGEGEVAFEVTPDRAGRFSYLVQVPDYQDDAVPGNNALPVVVRVVRDRIRVLQVAGSPSWDVKFLRRFLKGDPSVDLVSFFILRTRRDLASDWDESELSLIQFPYQQLFTDELKTFDLVVFQNFDHEPYFEGYSETLLANLRDFVEKDGHAIVMVGGDRSFSLGGYGGTPLAEVLPVDMAEDKVEPDPTPFRPELTDAGKRHPITRLVADPDENETWWGRLHTLDGTNVGLRPKHDAAVLLRHPTLRGTDGELLSVLSVRESGKGRTMALTVDTSWRWSLSEAAVGRGNQAYLRFWKSAMRWLVQDPTTSRVTVDTRRENYVLGDEVKLVVSARDPDFAPLKQGKVHAVVQTGADRWQLEGATGPDGEAVVAFPTERRGAHRVDVTVKDASGHDVGVASTVFAVTSRDPELDEVAPDAAFLQWLATRSGGVYHGPGDDGPLLRDPTAGRTVWDRREVEVWRSPLVALWIGLFAGLAWIVRRRAGLR